MSQKQVRNDIRWSHAASLPAIGTPSLALAPGLAGAVCGVSNNSLLIAGGANFPGGLPWEGAPKTYHDDIYCFEKNKDDIKAPAAALAQKLPARVAYSAVVSTPDGIIYAGGENEKGITRKVYRLQYNGARSVDIQPLPSLPLPLTNASAAVCDNKLFVAGGESAAGPSSAFFCLDLSLAGAAWQSLPGLPLPATHTVLITQSNGDHDCCWLIGGRRKNADGISTLYDAVFCYDPDTRQWIKKQSLPWALSAASAVTRGANYILLLGGDRGATFSAVERLTLAIDKAATTQERDTLIQQKNALLTNHPGFNKELLLYNTITDTWVSIGSYPYAPVATTTALNWGDDIIIPSGEIRAGVRTPDIVKGEVQKKAFFSALDYTILALYFLVMIWIGWRSSKHQHSTEDYFKGGKKIPAWASGLSIFGAKLSAITFISIPAKTYALDWTNFFFLMTIVMVMPVVLKYFIPFYRKLNVTTAYEYLQARFNYGVRLLASLLFVLLQVGRMGIVLLLPSLALSVVTGIDVMTGILIMGTVSVVYTVMGGIEAVIWTEVVQVLILLSGAVITMVVIPFMIPDWHGAWQSLQAQHKLRVFDFMFNFTRPTFWVVVLGGLATHINIYGCDQTVVQRYLTTKDENEAKKSLKLGAWMTVPSTILFFSIGTLLYLFYKAHPGSANIALDSQDTVFPWFMVSQLPKGISGLVITAIFAASMGSLNSSVNSVATVMVNDWFKPLLRGRPEKFYLNLAKGLTLAVGVFATVIALLMARLNIPSLWDQFNMLVGFFTGGIAGVFLLGIFSKKANGPGVLIGLIGSALLQYVIKYNTSLSLFLYAVTGLLSSIMLGWLFSLIIRPKTNRYVPAV